MYLFTNDLLAQRPSIDSLYKRGKIGFFLINSSSVSINTFFIKNFNVYSITPGIGIDYFFKNRFSLNSHIHFKHRWSNRPDLSPTLSFMYGEVQTRYYLRNWYFSTGISMGNFPFLLPLDSFIEPRTTLRAFLGTGLHVRTSPYKKFWRDIFFVIDLQVGKNIYIEYKPDGFSSTDGIRPSGYIGLHYLIPRKK
jgi:hypothetical protein